MAVNYTDDVTKKLESAKKNLEWMEISKPSVAARDCCTDSCDPSQPANQVTSGVALPPHERDCGRSHPMRGTNSEDLTEWCIRHET